MKKGLSHLETEDPYANYGPGQCHTCRTRHWCMLFRTNPAGRKPGGGQGASITPLQLL
mgnify:CR=1 FL=1